MLSEEVIKKNYPTSKPDIVKALVSSLSTLAEKYGLNTPLRLAHFLAQTAHESGGFRVVEENLNYSADGLMKIFPKYFRDKDPNEYARKPEKIANVVYASRMGNGDTASGDGYRFRGRGLIQLTGKNNYSGFATDSGINVDEAVAYLATPSGAVESAAWFWNKNGLNTLADKDDVTAVTKRINGGTIGLDDRIKHTKEFKQILGA
ncbi:COG3179 Predicted chitinase [uncultured Caudovirales phage]|uniref:COG3179 Predicted chitinase n=1 Tax=uncultured Caudovirales phage TaxID=2100421 RepID=A0A6J7WX79_9CAUD|nr:COG3179 Predicted chitinase [uncultured Caudovirales phage]